MGYFRIAKKKKASGKTESFLWQREKDSNSEK